MSDVIEIACSIDAAYAPHLAVMLKSLQRANPGESFRAHVLHDGIDEELRARVDAVVPGIEIAWKDCRNDPAMRFRTILHISRAVYLRLTLAEVLPLDVMRVLFLDADLVVDGGIRPLWKLDLKGKVCAAATDPGVRWEDFSRKWNLSPEGRYFNAGVMLFDMERLRAGGHLKQALGILEEHERALDYIEQCALNIALHGQWLPLDPRWNFQRARLYADGSAWQSIDPAPREPVIIHFTESHKPWRSDEWHPYAWLYLRNLWGTPFWKSVCRAGKINPVVACKWWLRWIIKRPRSFPDPLPKERTA